MLRIERVDMSSEMQNRILALIEAEARVCPSPTQFDMAYQVRVAMDRIKSTLKTNGAVLQTDRRDASSHA